jgi:secondary thiamine-phosphate synthase enzyme
MNWHKDTIEIVTRGKGLYDITKQLAECIDRLQVHEGMCHLYIPHTSASLVISENHDPSAKLDIENFMERLAPERQPWQRHTQEGEDDSPSHIRTVLTNVDLSIPVDDGKLSLGTWQGVYLFEHRTTGRRRQILIRVLGME